MIWALDGPLTGVEPNYDSAWAQHPLYRELFALLRDHQFATEVGDPDAYYGKLLMTREQALYLVRLFQGAAAAASFPE